MRDRFVQGLVDLPRDEFRRCFHRLCAMVNAHDALGMYLMVSRRSEQFFTMADGSPWLEVAWTSNEPCIPYVPPLLGGTLTRFGVCEVVKPVGEEFLIEEIFSISRFDDFDLVVTDEPGFPEGVRSAFSYYMIHNDGFEALDERWLRGTRSYVYSPGNIDEDNIYDNEFGAFATYTKEFVGIFPRSARFE